jgi:hypothetical protein
MLQRNVNTKSNIEKTTHKLVKYKWDEKAKSQFLVIKDAVCMELVLKKDKINEALNILYFLVKSVEADMRFTEIAHRKKEHCFEEGRMEKMEETKKGFKKI